MMKNQLSVFILMMIILCSVLSANDSLSTLPSGGFESIEWQKIKLQESTRRRYESVISKIITSSKFVVNVKLDTISADKIKAAKPKGEFKNVKQIKYNNNPTSESKGDLIIFSKLGLEAPIIPDEDNYKRESIKKTINEISTIFDIFNYLQAINVEILLNEKLEIKTRKVVEDLIIGTQAFSNQKIKPRVTIKYISMEEKFVQEKKIEPSMLEKIITLAPKYANALGLIFSVLILGAVVSILFQKYFDLQEKQMEIMKSQSQKVENKNNNENNGHDQSKTGTAASSAGNITEEESIKAFQRFKNFLNDSPVESQLLIKKWIKSEDDLSKLALNALVKQLTNEELKTIFEFLSLEERKTWKSKLKLDLNDDDVKLGNTYVSSQIVDDIIAPPMIKDPELIKIISNLTPKQGADISQLNIESGVILMNIMPPKFLAEMMEILPGDRIDSIIELSAKCSEEELSSKLDKFKEQMPAAQAIINKSPFLENITAHIAFATPNTERSLFKLLASFETLDLVVQTAIANLPVEVIKKIPEKIVKSTLQTFPQSQRIHYFFSVEESQRVYLLNLFASEGSKARELINFEFEKIQNDPALIEEIEKNKLSLEKVYFQAVRKVVRNSPEYTKDMKPIVIEWIDRLINPQIEDQVDLSLGNSKDDDSLNHAA